MRWRLAGIVAYAKCRSPHRCPNHSCRIRRRHRILTKGVQMQQATEKSHISPQKVVLGLDVPAAQTASRSRLPWSRGEKGFVLVASLLFLAFSIGSITKEAV